MAGPFVEYTTTQWLHIWKARYRQPRPYKKPLPFALQVGTCQFEGDTSPSTNAVGAAGYTSLALVENDSVILTQNKAYARFVEKAKGDSAGWAETMAQYNQAGASITLRATQLAKFVRSVNRFDVHGAASALNEALSPRGQKNFRRNFNKDRAEKYARSKDASQLLLEYTWGWKPLAQDIYNSCKILGFVERGGHIYASASGHFDAIPIDVKTYSNVNGWLKSYEEKLFYRCRVSSRTGATVVVNNYNKLLWNQMGLINPAGLVWELTPYSHVADWFGNVGQMLYSMTDMYGLTISDDYHSLKLTTAWTHKRVAVEEGNGNWVHENGFNSGSSAWVARGLGLITPRLIFTYKVQSLLHGAQAVAMLVNLLPRK